jgi:putative cardiolipin synthase
MCPILRSLVCGLLIVLAGCASLPDQSGRTTTQALTDTAGTHLGRKVAPDAAAHPGLTGVHALVAARDAFAARVLLARAAERSIDAQYYIWRNDISGGLLAEALLQAAERGVRVRLLLDDANTSGLDDVIATLGANPNIEVRLFNPFGSRGLRLPQLLGDFSRLNRRMHNKSFTVDNQVTVVGGRNVGDEYFGVESVTEFEDLDLLAAGAAVPQVSASFDAYWNSASAYPAKRLLHAPADGTAERVREGWAELHRKPEGQLYLEEARATPLVTELAAGSLSLQWSEARVLADNPDKVLQPPERDDMNLLPQLEAALGQTKTELDLVSPYFVPTEAGTQAFTGLVARGVKVRVLTNSLAATDVGPVHAGYSRYRKALLEGGVKLYELKPGARAEQDRPKRQGGSPGGGSTGGSSSSSLHAKTFAVDRSRIFVGSFNFDPRSARLNTEMGLVVQSPELSVRLSDAFENSIPRQAYEVRLSGDKLQWIERSGADTVVHDSEPETSSLRSLWVHFLSVMPIEWLL